MSDRVNRHGLQVARQLADFIDAEALPGTSVEPDVFWQGVAALVADLSPRNAELLAERDRLQTELDSWFDSHPGPIADPQAYQSFLTSIGYLREMPAVQSIRTQGVDDEIARLAGPQLVVPMTNARYALNAANSRWGSLYDALYGTDAIDEDDGRQRGGAFNPVRALAVVDYAKAFLDRIAPLKQGAHAAATGYAVRDRTLVVFLPHGETGLRDPALFAGHGGPAETPSAVLLRHHGLHVDIQIDRSSEIGANDAAGVKDVIVEAALTTIMDCEDSVAAVDADDKTLVYRNWLGLMKGTLTESVTKAGRTFTRRLASDRVYTACDGQPMTLCGRSLMFVRNVGHLMTTPAVLDMQGQPVPEGMLDAVVTALCALHDRERRGNSRTGSIYIVKPKMHGPDEVAFADTLFARVEDILGLPRHTIKMGIMDEERRTSVNLMACILAAQDRVAFINTGFLDRTGDEIHSAMRAGPMRRKGDMKSADWISAYERHNVLVGLACGLRGRAQIGKGMWAMPDLMAAMLAQKSAHPRAGANTAWVPSPTAATLHALHYHEVDVSAVQADLMREAEAAAYEQLMTPLLTVPIGNPSDWSESDIRDEVDNNVQGILGYVVRWIDQGVGCSKVPDIHNVGLMEDRATLRISSQHLANWLFHDVISAQQVEAAFERMAAVVDAQNADDPHYRSSLHPGSIAMQAAKSLVFQGESQPNGYTEPLLHDYRLRLKRESVGHLG